MADAASFENPVILNLMSSYGPILIGAIFQCVLYGMAVLQLFLYFNNYERDSIWMKLYVRGFTMAIETASTISVLAAKSHSMAGYDSSLGISTPAVVDAVHRVWMTGLSTFLVHMFFIYRIYMGLQSVGGAGTRWFCLRNPDLATLSGRFLTNLGTSGRSIIAFVDIAIVAMMIYSLLREGYPRFQSSRRMIFRLIVLTINTGLWTAVFAIIDLGLIVPYPNQLYYCAVDFPLTSLYLNSLLANLNARDYIRSAAGDVEHNSYPMGDSTFRATTRGITSTNQSHGIHIQTSTDTTIYGDTVLGSKLPIIVYFGGR
ncbi:hypothetical protein BD309DRAFT_872291 [Dichomitus squalens]|uniref:DUF6534 domain-containing protein n=1 Tax=Dichomitus squalens TaxID=114155 RepID=A0A4Q9NJM9_9APHY|nr:hypothetical protein BD311DRAFT_664064 [Dichomitus squalens]TBU39446.1 hypothetical protein BD309DRAFT_872291 [Dichomitus squalens]TBU60144.1 hypothetical protein BD310DRAFT_815971 [Dichomitus squalens]